MTFTVAAYHLELLIPLVGYEGSFAVVLDFEKERTFLFYAELVESSFVWQGPSEHMPEVLEVVLVLSVDLLLLGLLDLLFNSIQMLHRGSLQYFSHEGRASVEQILG